ncbi:NAD+ kinase [Bacilli bacterium PM5-3]|nr:NAD+ kinase [Bacilli bacterium PM5-3]MDH6603643.1 NAD+ kinase [Bacilli bacterium PM5-9]
MKSFDVFFKNDELSIKVADKIKTRLLEASFDYDTKTPDLVVSVGGDGTMLKAIHHHLPNIDQVSFCGIHTGTLGFYTDFLVSEIDDLVDKIIAQEYYEIAFNMLCVKVNYGGKVKTIHALNEARIENNQHTQVMDVFVNNHYFETFRGNGLNFSTPTGSTGYNKSLGGAIMHPKTKAMQICEIASINNIAYRALGSPLILDQSHTVMIKLQGVEGAILGYDSYSIDLENECNSIESITFELSDKMVKFARYKTLAFMDRVKKNFIVDDI